MATAETGLMAIMLGEGAIQQGLEGIHLAFQICHPCHNVRPSRSQALSEPSVLSGEETQAAGSSKEPAGFAKESLGIVKI